MDAEYLESTVASYLSQGIAATVAAMPDDPVEYLAVWLRNQLKEEQMQKKVFFSCLFSFPQVQRNKSQAPG
jgi:hypothetical protein